jgi:hypothetical protein
MRNFRKFYETATDRDREANIIGRFMVLSGLSKQDILIRATPPGTAWDYSLFSGNEIVGLVEIKTRFVSSTTYPTLILSARKVDALLSFTSPNGTNSLPVILLVQYTDGLFWTPLNRILLDSCPIQTGGRTDRGDSKDIEPVYHIPVACLQPASRLPYVVSLFPHSFRL